MSKADMIAHQGEPDTRSQRAVDEDVNTPHARRVPPITDAHDHLKVDDTEGETRQEKLLDEGIEETFPASDPVSAKRIT